MTRPGRSVLSIPAPAIPLLLTLLLTLALACGGGDGAPSTATAAAGGGAEGGATPVTVARVEIATLDDAVSAPGRTVALVEESVRAPFDGTVTRLDVVEGDRVRRGAVVGEMVARDSEAARLGARQMERRAATPAERDEAARALELARQNLVARPLRASVAGRVTARFAAAGSQVTADQELVTLVAADSLVFRADLSQADLAAVRPGQAATVAMSGDGPPVAARVRGLLAPGDQSDLTAPLRLDFVGSGVPPAEGLYGTARIVVGEHREVPVVPAAAVLRDDVSGSRRVATVISTANDGGAPTLHWIEVEIGLEDGSRVEIVSPRLAAGTRVVVSGQVGLAEGTPLAVQP